MMPKSVKNLWQFWKLQTPMYIAWFCSQILLHSTEYHQDPISIWLPQTWRLYFPTLFTHTHTIHIPVMENADRLTGRTIQAVMRQSVSYPCPKHEGLSDQGYGDGRRDAVRWSHAGLGIWEEGCGGTIGQVLQLHPATFRWQPVKEKERFSKRLGDGYPELITGTLGMWGPCSGLDKFTRDYAQKIHTEELWIKPLTLESWSKMSRCTTITIKKF